MLDAIIVHPSPSRVGKLDSLRRVRLELTKIYKEARSGTLPTQEATRLCYILQSIAKLIESSEIEKRLENVELHLESIAEKANGQN